MTESEGDAIRRAWDIAKEPSRTAYCILYDGEFHSVSKEIFELVEGLRNELREHRSAEAKLKTYNLKNLRKELVGVTSYHRGKNT